MMAQNDLACRGHRLVAKDKVDLCIRALAVCGKTCPNTAQGRRKTGGLASQAPGRQGRGDGGEVAVFTSVNGAKVLHDAGN